MAEQYEEKMPCQKCVVPTTTKGLSEDGNKSRLSTVDILAKHNIININSRSILGNVSESDLCNEEKNDHSLQRKKNNDNRGDATMPLDSFETSPDLLVPDETKKASLASDPLDGNATNIKGAALIIAGNATSSNIPSTRINNRAPLPPGRQDIYASDKSESFFQSTETYEPGKDLSLPQIIPGHVNAQNKKITGNAELSENLEELPSISELHSLSKQSIHTMDKQEGLDRSSTFEHSKTSNQSHMTTEYVLSPSSPVFHTLEATGDKGSSSDEEAFQPIILDVRGGLSDFDMDISSDDAEVVSEKSNTGSPQPDIVNKINAAAAESTEVTKTPAFELLKNMVHQANYVQKVIECSFSSETLKSMLTKTKDLSIISSSPKQKNKLGGKISRFGDTIILPKTTPCDTSLVFSTQIASSPKIISTCPSDSSLPHTAEISTSVTSSTPTVNRTTGQVDSLSKLISTSNGNAALQTVSNPSTLSNQYMKYSCVFVQNNKSNQQNKVAFLIPQTSLTTLGNQTFKTAQSKIQNTSDIQISNVGELDENSGRSPLKSSANESTSASERISDLVSRTINNFHLTGAILKKYGDLLKPEIQDAKEHSPSHSQCCACGEEFHDLEGLMFHLKRPIFSLKYACSFCKMVKVFSNKCALWKHLRSETSNAVLDYSAICSLGPYEFADIEGSHVESMPSVAEIFSQNSQAETVNLETSAIQDHTTQIPEASVQKNSSREAKVIRIVGVKKVTRKCLFCLENVRDMAYHLCSARVGKYECELCKMILPTRCALGFHSKIHTVRLRRVYCSKIKIFCPECGEHQFKSSDGSETVSAVFEHLDTCKHFNRTVDFTCDCGQVFASRKHLVNHFVASHLKVLFKCPFCVLAFTQHDHFLGHADKIHKIQGSVADSPVLCAICQQLLKCADDAKAHIDYHMKKFNLKACFRWKCFICSKRFDQKSELNNHSEVDHPHKPKRCTLCFRLFSNRKKLVDHIVLKQCSVTLPCNLNSCVDIQLTQEKEVKEVDIAKLFNHPNIHNKNTQNKVKVVELPNATPILSVQSNSLEKAESVFASLLPEQSHSNSGNVEDNTLHQCGPCRIIITGKQNYSEHLKDHAAKGKCNNGYFTRCIACKKLIRSSKLYAHLKDHQSGGVITCAWCQQRNFKSIEEISNHSRTLCGYRFVKGAGIVKKVRTENVKEIEDSSNGNDNSQLSPTTGNFVPNIDQPESSSSATFSIQQSEEVYSAVEGENNSCQSLSVFPCLLCGLAFQSLQARDEHVSRLHDGTRLVYHCMMCKKKGQPRTFANKKLASRHICKKHRIVKIAMVEKLIKTEEQNVSSGQKLPACGQESSDGDGVPLPKRLRIAGLGDFMCGKCGFSASDSQEFTQHILSHNTSNEPQCPECGLCFTIIHALKKHLFVVHKIKAVEEYLKGKNIIEPELEDEMESLPEIYPLPTPPPVSMDSPEKKCVKLTKTSNPFECTVCYKVFDSEIPLKTHMRSHGMAFIRSRRHKS